MAAEDIDGYLASLEEPKRSTLEALRRSILDVVPEAEQCISYGMPAFKVQGKTVAGFAAFENHLSYLPHSGSVLGELGTDLAEECRSLGRDGRAVGAAEKRGERDRKDGDGCSPHRP